MRVENSLEIKIRDNGKGISKKNIKRVFYRGVSIDKPGGSGLGLADALEIIESSGGTLEIDSKLNEGTTVTIRLPLFESKHLSHGKGPYKNVMVEDFALSQYLWLQKAKEKDLSFIVFSSPADFEANIAKVSPDARIFIDSNFPDYSEKGQHWAEKIHDRGFKNLWLCPSDDVDISTMPWLQGIAPKERPFEI